MRARAEARPTPLGPGGRPLRGLRIPVALLSLANVAANGLIMLSDRAPGVLRRLSTTVDAGVARAATAAGAARAAADARIPQSDVHVHLSVWASAALLVGLAAWSWRSLLVGAGAVFALSAGMEAAQGLYSSTRSVQLADVAANALGGGLGGSGRRPLRRVLAPGAGRPERPGARRLLRWLRVVGAGSREISRSNGRRWCSNTPPTGQKCWSEGQKGPRSACRTSAPMVDLTRPSGSFVFPAHGKRGGSMRRIPECGVERPLRRAPFVALPAITRPRRSA